MNTSLPPSTSDIIVRPNVHEPDASRSTVSWGAIFAGVTAALALQVLFMMLGTGLGLSVYSPMTSDNPVSNLSMGALIIHSVCAILALCFGGWVAGRFTPARIRASACLHGFIVWCAATVGGVLLVTMGAGAMLGGATSLIGGGLSAVGQPVAAVADGAADLAGGAMEQSGETITSFVEEAVSNLAEDGPASEGIRAKREIGYAVARLFNPAQDGNTEANREAAVTALVDHTGMSQADANRAVTDWTETFERMQDDLAEMKEAAAIKAREVADSTADALAKISLWSFVGFLIGAIAASLGGYLGAKCATRCEEKTDEGYVPAKNV